MRDQRLWLADLLDSAAKLFEWSSAITEPEFNEHDIAYSAILREFIVIGEAVKRLDVAQTSTRPDIPWRELARFRDVVVHTYFGLQDEVVWHAARTIISDLIRAVRAMLDEIEAESPTPPPATGPA